MPSQIRPGFELSNGSDNLGCRQGWGGGAPSGELLMCLDDNGTYYGKSSCLEGREKQQGSWWVGSEQSSISPMDRVVCMKN